MSHSVPLVRHSWLIASIAVAMVCAWQSMSPGFRPDAISQDVPTYVFWLSRAQDPELFRNDLAADYYQSVSPIGFRAVYWVFTPVADPVLVSKGLPFFLGFIIALFVFLAARSMLSGNGSAGLLASSLVSYYIWQCEDLQSASPRSFLLPALSAQLWALASGRFRIAAAIVVVTGLLYPMGAVLGLSMLALRLLAVRQKRLMLTRDTERWMLVVLPTVILVALLLPFALTGGAYGPVVTRQEAEVMPEFGATGRNGWFKSDPFDFWIISANSGLSFEQTFSRWPKLPILWAYLVPTVLLPLLWIGRRWVWSAAALRETRWLGILALVSLAWFFLAHVTLFRLYHPGRFVGWTWPLIFAIGAGLATVVVLDTLLKRLKAGWMVPVRISAVVSLAMIPFLVSPPKLGRTWVINRLPTVTAYLQTLPKDVVVAGIPVDTNDLPAFALRSVVANYAYADAYHLGYYREYRERIEDLVDVFYTQSIEEARTFTERYGVDLFLVNKAAYNRKDILYSWIGFTKRTRWLPFTSTVLRKFSDDKSYVLLELSHSCGTLTENDVTVVMASCLYTGHFR